MLTTNIAINIRKLQRETDLNKQDYMRTPNLSPFTVYNKTGLNDFFSASLCVLRAFVRNKFRLSQRHDNSTVENVQLPPRLRLTASLL